MKPISINDTNYSLHNTDNFKKTLDYNSNEILSKYSDLLTEYLKFFFENNKIKSYTEGKAVLKVIVVPKKLVNVVVK